MQEDQVKILQKQHNLPFLGHYHLQFYVLFPPAKKYIYKVTYNVSCKASYKQDTTIDN